VATEVSVELQLLREKWGLLLAGLIFQVSCTSLLPWSLVAAGIINFVCALLLLICTACNSELLGRINIILNITGYPI
jgi:hypothetical protein